MTVDPKNDFLYAKIRVFLADCSKYLLLNFKIFRSIQGHADISPVKNQLISANKLNIENPGISVDEIGNMLAVQFFAFTQNLTAVRFSISPIFPAKNNR